MGYSNFKWISDGYFLWCSVLCCFKPFKELNFCIVVVLKLSVSHNLELCFCCTNPFFFFLWCLDLLPSLAWCVALYMCNFVFSLFGVLYCFEIIVYDSWVINQLIHQKNLFLLLIFQNSSSAYLFIFPLLSTLISFILYHFIFLYFDSSYS